jgi:hypothetical protein
VKGGRPRATCAWISAEPNALVRAPRVAPERKNDRLRNALQTELEGPIVAIRRPPTLKGRGRVPPRLLKDLPSAKALRVMAARAKYLGSPEHKAAKWEGIHPMGNPHSSKCPTSIETLAEATSMLQAAIKVGNVGETFQDEMPKYVWYKGSRGTFQARLTDRPHFESGKLAGYKAWPVDDEESLPVRPRALRVCDET